MGTPYYMAPEQLRDASAVDARADVYAMGVIMYQALTGRVPYMADSLAGLALQITTGCLLYTSPSPRDRTRCRMPSSA